MKKLLTLFLLIIPSAAFAQKALPYSDLLDMTDAQLQEAGFKFEGNRNRYVFKQNSRRNQIPTPEHYVITVQFGQEGIAHINVLFYDAGMYNDIRRFSEDNGENLKENAGNPEKILFGYDGNNVELTRYKQLITNTNLSEYLGYSSSNSSSFETYSYTIRTGVKPYSRWLKAQEKKKERRKAKGMVDAADWM